MATNIRFNYLYRDSGNYKKFGHKDYSNPESLALEEAEKQLREQLISTEFFYPEQANIPRFRFHRYLDDYSWYEFENLEMVEGGKCRTRFSEMIEQLKQNSQIQWLEKSAYRD
jgi:hypothetical protein